MIGLNIPWEKKTYQYFFIMSSMLCLSSTGHESHLRCVWRSVFNCLNLKIFLGSLGWRLSFCFTVISRDTQRECLGVHQDMGGIMAQYSGGIKSFSKHFDGILLRRKFLLPFRIWDLLIMHMGMTYPLDFSAVIFPDLGSCPCQTEFLLQVVRFWNLIRVFLWLG